MINFLRKWMGDGRLQTYEDRERFRKEAGELLAALPSETAGEQMLAQLCAKSGTGVHVRKPDGVCVHCGNRANELSEDFARAATLENDGHGYTVWRIGGRQFVPLDEAQEAVHSARETTRELAPSEAASFDKTLARSPRRVDSVLDFKVTVCSECLQASCWLGEFYCEKYRNASTVEKTVRELHALGPLEDPGYWFKSPNSGKVNQRFREAYESAVKASCESSGKIMKEPQ